MFANADELLTYIKEEGVEHVTAKYGPRLVEM